MTRIRPKGAAIATAASLGTPLAFSAKRLGDGQLSIVAINGPADKALKRAAHTLRGITGLEVVAQKAKVENGAITEYRTTIEVIFFLE